MRPTDCSTGVEAEWALQKLHRVSFGAAGSSWWAAVAAGRARGLNGFCPSFCGSRYGTDASASEGILPAGKKEKTAAAAHEIIKTMNGSLQLNLESQ